MTHSLTPWQRLYPRLLGAALALVLAGLLATCAAKEVASFLTY